MDFLQLAKARYSVRNFKPDEVEEDKLQAILQAGRVAPTAANLQPQRVLVVRSPQGLQKLRLGANVYGAPVALIVCADHASSWKRSHDGMDAAVIDATIVTDHMMMEAAALGLGTIWVCAFNPAVIREQFQIPEGFEPVNILGVGYAGGQPESPERHAQRRKPAEATIYYEEF